jgi:hypothetical protein
VHETITTEPATSHKGPCRDVPELERLRYFHGQPLGALDLRTEQAYHLETARLHHRLLHGWGIVCGLGVHVQDPPPCDPCDPNPDATVVVVEPGAAIDCHGNAIVVRRPRPVRLSRLLRRDALERLKENPATVHLTICFHEQLSHPSRPLLVADCEPVPSCEYGRVLECYRLCASTTAPDPGPACEPCCGACGDVCLELAAIRNFDPDAELEPEQLDLGGRRPIGLHDLAEITAINWVHGATYSRDDMTRLLAGGLELRFSRPVKVASLQEGVVDVRVGEGGGGRAGGLYAVDGTVDRPKQALTDRLVWRSASDERLQYGDRVTITVHGDHIVDECCRALDANHTAGAVPVLEDVELEPVSVPERPCPPRPSGNGSEGGEFVSWVYAATAGGEAR